MEPTMTQDKVKIGVVNKCKCGKIIDRRSKYCHSCSMLGKKYPNRKLSEIHKKNIGLARKKEWDTGMRKGGWKLTPEQIEKVRKAHIGRKTPIEVRIRQSKVRVGKYGGEKHWNWQGGISKIHFIERGRIEYRL